jgi:hypothetical protein
MRYGPLVIIKHFQVNGIKHMNQINLKTHYTAQELADFRLPGLPETRPGIVAGPKTMVGIRVQERVVEVVTSIQLTAYLTRPSALLGKNISIGISD